jgi:internalin A
LQQLNCHYTPVSDLSPVAGLVQLQQLYCFSTQVSDLSPVAGLVRLQVLNCSSTPVSDLSPVAGLVQLQLLSCSSTQVSDLSPVAGLVHLQILDFGSTQVSDLSPILPMIKKGRSVKLTRHEGDIRVKDCPLVCPPIEIVAQGNEAIIRYLEEIQAAKPEDLRNLNEAKLILIGQPRAGKTSLRYKLCDTERILPKPDLTTRGIDIEFQSFNFTDEHKKEQTFKYHIWDFGGQQIYHATHRFFLTKRTIYIAVVDTDVNDKQNDLDYWLHMIDLLGDGSPVLLVQNQKNDRSIEISDALRNRFRTILCAKDYELNLDSLRKKDNPKFNAQRLKDFQAFKEDIEGMFEKQPPILMTRQKNDVRLALETLRKTMPFIEHKEYVQICSDNGLPDPTAQSDLLRTLHNLGICLWYEGYDFLDRIVILQNRWATDAVFRVLDNETIKKEKGHFNRADLTRIWSDPEYAGRVGELVELMKRFKLCYQIDNSNEFIAPQLLDKNPPKDFSREIVQKGSVRMVVEYEFMPRGIITQFIVALHRSITGQQRHAWETGFAVQSLQGPKAVGMAEESYDSRKLELWASGPGAGLLLQAMLGELEKIHDSYNRLRYNKLIPCTCEHCSSPVSVRVKEFDYEEILLEKYQNRQSGIRCSYGNQIVPFEKLLGNLGFTQQQTELDYQRKTAGPMERLRTMEMPPPPEIWEQINKSQPTIFEKMNLKLWLPVLFSAFMIALFLAWAKPGSKLDFFGWFKVEQGSEAKPEKTEPAVPSSVTVVGSIKINGINAKTEEVKRVYLKGKTLVPPTTLSGNIFKLNEVDIPQNRIIEIAIDLKDVDISPSALFTLPEANKNNVADLGEVLIEVTRPKPSKSNGGKTLPPTVIINNTNIINQEQK